MDEVVEITCYFRQGLETKCEDVKFDKWLIPAVGDTIEYEEVEWVVKHRIITLHGPLMRVSSVSLVLD